MILQPLDFGAPRDLFLELAIDLRGHRAEAVEARLDALDELLLGRDPRHLAIEIVGDRNQVRRLLRPLVDDGQLARDRVHARVEFRQVRAEGGRPVEEALERRAIRVEPVAQLRRRRVGLVELLDFLPQRIEVLPALLQVVVLPLRLLRQLVHLRERFVQCVERRLLPLQLVGVRAVPSTPRGDRAR